MASTLSDRIDGISTTTAVKAACRVATTANITLSGEQTIDGVAVVADDRVLVWFQTDQTQNGIYVASASAWARAYDFDGNRDVRQGTRVFVNSGSLYGTTEFLCTTVDPIVIDTSNIVFATLQSLLNAAPGNAQYIVATANASLTAERVITNTATVTWDTATAAQVKANVVAGDASTPGVLELATVPEAVAGADTSRAVTPAGLLAAIAAVTPALPRGYHDGCILSNNAGDATNDIDVSEGAWRDSTNSVNLIISAMVKRLDANWAAGTNQGMRNSGAAITDGTYHIYLGSKAGGVDADLYAHTSTSVSTVLSAWQVETGGSLYVYARRIGSIIRISNAILGFIQDGDHFQLKTPVENESTNSIGSTSESLTLESIPNGIRVLAEFNATISSGSQGWAYFSDLSTTDVSAGSTSAPGSTLGWSGSGATAVITFAKLAVRTNTSRQIRASADSNRDLDLSTLGWWDPRGKDA
jgi:hypothetical protein